MVGKISSSLPPGFRFHPTDEELIMHYLRFQATSRPCPVSIIPEVDIYKFDPWELPDKAEFGEKEWYFFTPRDRKYPNGLRPNRAAVSGYWKATGTDKAIHSGSKYVGIKKALVFYKGRPPKGVKTDWIMHEYRLSESRSQPYKKNGSMRLDDWVLCRIYKKKSLGKAIGNNNNPREHDHHHQRVTHEDLSFPHSITTTTGSDRPGDQPQQVYNKLPRIASLTHLWEFDYMGSISNLMNDSCYNNSLFFSNNHETDTNHDHKNQLGQQQQQQPPPPCTDAMYLQQSYVNPMYGLQ